jgi:hypothetical protein
MQRPRCDEDADFLPLSLIRHSHYDSYRMEPWNGNLSVQTKQTVTMVQ